MDRNLLFFDNGRRSNGKFYSSAVKLFVMSLSKQGSSQLFLSPPNPLLHADPLVYGNLPLVLSKSSDPRRRPRTWWVFKHMPDSNIEFLYYHLITRKLKWRCKHCPKRHALKGGTRVIKLHLGLHGISESSPHQKRLIQRQRTIKEAVASEQNNPRKRRLIDTNVILEDSPYVSPILICSSALEQLYVDFQTSCNLPFSLVQSASFRNLIWYINPDADNILTESPSTAKAIVMGQFAK